MSKILLSNVTNTININYNLVKDATIENLCSQVDKTKNFIEQDQQFECLRKKFIHFHKQKKELDKIEATTQSRLEEWKQKHTSSSSSTQVSEYFAEKRSQIVKKAKWVKCAEKVAAICTLALIAISILGLGSLIVMSGLYTIVPLAIFTAIGIAIGIAIGGSAFLATITGVSTVILNRMNVVRQKRALTSQNFQYFIDSHLKEKGFTPKQQDLTDLELHRIYLDWRKQILALGNHRIQ